MRCRGFSVAELVVALLVASVVAAAAARALVWNSRAHRTQVDRLLMNATLRLAAAIIPATLRPLDPDDLSGGDLTGLGATSVAYRASRSLHVVCAVAASRDVLIVGRPRLAGYALDPARDSLLVYAERDSTTPADDGWIRADLVAAAGAPCPDGRAGTRLTLGAPVAGIRAGAPALAVEPTELRAYRGSAGERWVGVRTRRKDGAWTSTQPLLGPVAPDGLQIVYFDRAGSVVSRAERVARIGLTISAVPPNKRQPEAAVRVQIALRNAE